MIKKSKDLSSLVYKGYWGNVFKFLKVINDKK